MFLSWVRPDRISSPMTSSAAVQCVLRSRRVLAVAFRRNNLVQDRVGTPILAADDRICHRRRRRPRRSPQRHRSSSTAPKASPACASAGRLAAEILDALPRMSFPASPPGNRRHRPPADDRGRRRPRDARLSRLHQELLHLDQPCRLPRHSRRQGAQGRRHRQYRRHPDPRRLARRHQPHVPRRRRADEGAASWSTSPTNA